MRDRFGIFGTVTRIRKLSTFGNDVKNTQQRSRAALGILTLRVMNLVVLRYSLFIV